MSITDHRITARDIAENGIQSRPNKLTGTAAQNKAAFDALVENVVAVRFNRLIEELSGSTGAQNIGFSHGELAGDTIYEAMAALLKNQKDMSEGTLADGSVTEAKLCRADGEQAVTTAVLRSGAVTADKIANGAVTSAKLDTACVGTAALKALCVTEALLADKCVTADKLAAQAVGTAALAEGAVTENRLAAGAVTADKLADGAVTAAKLSAGCVTADALSDGCVTAAKLASDVTPAALGLAEAQLRTITWGTGDPPADGAEGDIYLQLEE